MSKPPAFVVKEIVDNKFHRVAKAWSKGNGHEQTISFTLADGRRFVLVKYARDLEMQNRALQSGRTVRP